MENPTTITVIGSLCAGIATLIISSIFSIWAGNLQKKQDDADKQELKNDNLVLRKENKELRDLSLETLNNVLAKDSYSYIKIIIPENSNSPDNGEETAQVSLFQTGKYPIKNLKVSIVNSDEEADYEPHDPNDYKENPAKYHKPQNPYVIEIPILVPGQRLTLTSLNIVRRKQKSFNIFFSANNDIWFQRIILRDAKQFGASKTEEIKYFTAFTQVYKVDFDPKLNQVYRHETIINEGAHGNGFARVPLILYNDGEKKDFPFVKTEKRYRIPKWSHLHWNGVALETMEINIPSKEIIGPLRDF